MISLHRTMDPRGLEIRRQDKPIGDLLWHPDRSPRIILHEAGEYLSITELKFCLDKYKEVATYRRPHSQAHLDGPQIWLGRG